jgi:hypothetical protein
LGDDGGCGAIGGSEWYSERDEERKGVEGK